VPSETESSIPDAATEAAGSGQTAKSRWPEYGTPEPLREKETPTPFGARLRRLRQARGHSQSSLAAKAGIAQQLIGLLERGRHSPTLTTVNKLAVGLNVSLSDLLGPKPFGETNVLADLVAAVEVAERDMQKVRTLVDLLVGLAETAGPLSAPVTGVERGEVAPCQS
jgi:transcriptional regulator with XRE-family HTH domain